ncbi:MAG: hypothetical protein ACT4PJ_14085 [Gemmatimonadaceae bacterium]
MRRAAAVFQLTASLLDWIGDEEWRDLTGTELRFQPTKYVVGSGW